MPLKMKKDSAKVKGCIKQKDMRVLKSIECLVTG